MTTQKSIQASRESIKNCGMSAQNGYDGEEEVEEEVYKGYVRTNTGEVLVQIPDPESRWGFYLADEDQSWDGGFGILASAFEAISESEVSEEEKERLGWILSQ